MLYSVAWWWRSFGILSKGQCDVVRDTVLAQNTGVELHFGGWVKGICHPNSDFLMLRGFGTFFGISHR